MSFTDNVSVAVAAAPSFKEKLAQRRKELEENTSFEMAVPGYENLWARYRVLGYEDMRSLGLAIETEVENQAAGERLTAAATLLRACDELLEFQGPDAQGKPIFASLGCRWSLYAARELFGLELPDGVEDREALLQIFPYPRDMLLVTHFNDYVEMGMGYLPQIEEALMGESPAASAATSWPSQQVPQQ